MMYVGDVQVVTGNGMMTSSESLFQTSIENHHNSYTFLPQSNLPFRAAFLNLPKEEMGLMGRGGGKEEMESGSGSEHIDGGGSGNEQEYLALEQQQQQNPNSKKKRYHRHTARQIQEMEAMFKECPHPDDKQRMKLSTELGLKPRQVKFWFQNRRTQMKAQQDRADNAMLRAENENLKSENYRLQAALHNIVCPTCGGPGMMGEISFDEQKLRLENARLKDEFERVCCLAAQYCGRPIHTMGQTPSSLLPPTSSLDLDMNIYPRQQYEETITQMMPVSMMTRENSQFLLPNNNNGAHGVMIMEEEKSLALELTISFVDELVKMCQTGDPLWTTCNTNILDGPREVLNMEEHAKMFSWPISKKCNLNQEWRHEATRASAVVIMNSITLVDAFFDAKKWIDLFPSIISRAKTLQIITSGVSGHANGSLQLMYAELQVLSPLVPTRETHFLRYCHHNAEEGTWAIVDFPLDSFHENYTTTSYPRYRRRPSGCIIQDMPNGYSRVTWVEHAEVADGPIHRVFNEFVTSGMAFGAQRWLAVLQRQCERLASLMARNISDLGVIPSPEARKNLMNLSQRMIQMFCVNVSSACGQSWTALSDSADSTVRITTRKVAEPGQPNGLILCAVSTTWFPYPHYQVFDLLKDERRRAQLDVLSNANALHEVAHIANGSHPGNCISLLRVNVASNSSQNVELVLQESCTDESGSLVVYSTIDVEAIQLAMNGQDPSCIPLLPLGFVIVPMTKSTSCNAGDCTTRLNSSPDDQYYSLASPENYINGCLVTVGLQVLASSIPTAKLNLSSASAINNHICNTMQQISAALSSGIDAGGNDNVSGDVVSGNPPASAAALPNKVDDIPTP